MAVRATNTDESVRGAGLPACRRLSSRRAERSSAAARKGRPHNAFSMERRFRYTADITLEGQTIAFCGLPFRKNCSVLEQARRRRCQATTAPMPHRSSGQKAGSGVSV